MRRYPPANPELPEVKFRPYDLLCESSKVERYAHRRALNILQLCVSAIDSGNSQSIEQARHFADMEIDAFENGVIIVE